MTNFSVSITSDTVCPWCYVGLRKLEAGIAAYRSAHPSGGDDFTMDWSPFYLNPDAPKQGIDKGAYYQMRFGAERTAAIFSRLTTEGGKVGINFDFGGRTGNTRDSHRVVAMAKRTGGIELQNKVVREIFRSYFEEKGDITDHAVITNAAVKAGLDKAVVEKWLKDGDGGEEVDMGVEKARRQSITGVPNFVINGRYEIQGAQDAEGFKSVFEKIKEMES